MSSKSIKRGEWRMKNRTSMIIDAITTTLTHPSHPIWSLLSISILPIRMETIKPANSKVTMNISLTIPVKECNLTKICLHTTTILTCTLQCINLIQEIKKAMKFMINKKASPMKSRCSSPCIILLGLTTITLTSCRQFQFPLKTLSQ